MPVFYGLFLAVNLSPNPLSETFYYKGVPTPRQIDEWVAQGGSPSFLIEVENPTAGQVLSLKKLAAAGRLRMESAFYPASGETGRAWRELAEAGAEFVYLGALAPNAKQVKALNEISFPRIVFSFTEFPRTEEVASLRDLKSEFSVSFNTAKFPAYEHRDMLNALPAKTRLLFVTDYWPWYSHMDVMNLTPHPKRIRVRGATPSAQNLEYLANIKNLEEVAMETDFDVSPSLWPQFPPAQIPRLAWISKERVPSAKALSGFSQDASDGTRRFVLNLDGGLTNAERARLEGAGIPVEWIHSK